MKKTYFYLFIYLLLFFNCTNASRHSSVNEVDVKTILVDVDNDKEIFDLSPYLQDKLDIIPLETNDTCLISNIIKLEYADDLICISDEISQVIFLFDSSGKYLKSIGKKGAGPGEYSSLGDFVLIGDSIYVQDMFVDKIIVYSIKTEGFREFHLENLSYSELISFDNILYCLTNYGKTPLGYYNMLRLDLDSNTFTANLPFDKKIAENNTAWGLNRYSSKYKDSALAIFAKNDTIYEVTQDLVVPKYVIHFSKQNLPHDIKEKGGHQAILAAHKNNYITGVDRISQTKDYIFLSYSLGNNSKELFYNKHSNEYQIAEWIVVGSLGNLYGTNLSTTENGELIVVQNAYMLKNAWEHIYSKHDFSKEKDHALMKSIVENLDESDNPIVFKFKFKNI